MDIEGKLNEVAVYFAPGPSDKQGRRSSYLAPVEVRCHWENNAETKKLPGGEEWLSKTQVITAVPLKEEGYLWYGEVAGLTSSTVPQNNKDAVMVRVTERVPSVDASQRLYVAFA